MKPETLLKNWREAESKGVLEAAQAVEVDRITWWRWECGKSNVALDKLEKVEAITGIPRAQLRPDIFGPAPKEAAE